MRKVGTRLFLRIPGAVEPARELFDPALCLCQRLGERAAERFPALPEARELLELDLAPLEPLDDRLELGLVLLEAPLALDAHCGRQCTRAAKAPRATSTSRSLPGA